MKKRRTIRRIITILIILLIAVAGYVAYVFLSYERLPDRQYIETQTTGAYSYFADDEAINAGRAYNFVTYNIGFGAYTKDYSFFMDGGKYSWAQSEEGLMANICEISDVINKTGADFVLLQEVDLDGTRTYHIDELELLNEFIKGYYYAYSVNYNSKFMLVPPWQPHGANKSCLVTYSKGAIAETVRRSLPIDEGIGKYFDYDRCYAVSKIPLANEKMLCIYNVHLSAYSDDKNMKNAQLEMLFNDMENEYKMGNYVVCGGDFNRNMKKDAKESEYSWGGPFPRDMLPKGFRMAIDEAVPANIEHDSCRNANEPYNEETTFTVTTDGFIVSDNIRVNFYTNCNGGYEFSDHDPVMMQILLKE